MPSASYAIAQFGGDSKVVGRTSFCPKPQSGDCIIVGDALNVNIEMVMAIKPDIVITSNFTKQTTVDKIKSLGIKTVCLSTPKDFNDICNQTVELGKLIGLQDKAIAFVNSEKAKVSKIIKNYGGQKGKMYIQVGTEPLFGATPDYYANDFAALLGCQNVLSANEGACSRDVVASRKPDLIIISSLGGLGKSEEAKWKKICKKADTIVIDENLLSCPTPENFRISLEKICSLMKKNKVDGRSGASITR